MENMHIFDFEPFKKLEHLTGKKGQELIRFVKEVSIEILCKKPPRTLKEVMEYQPDRMHSPVNASEVMLLQSSSGGWEYKYRGLDECFYIREQAVEAINLAACKDGNPGVEGWISPNQNTSTTSISSPTEDGEGKTYGSSEAVVSSGRCAELEARIEELKGQLNLANKKKNGSVAKRWEGYIEVGVRGALKLYDKWLSGRENGSKEPFAVYGYTEQEVFEEINNCKGDISERAIKAVRRALPDKIKWNKDGRRPKE